MSRKLGERRKQAFLRGWSNKGPHPKLRSSLGVATARLECLLNAMRTRDELDRVDIAQRAREWA